MTTPGENIKKAHYVLRSYKRNIYKDDPGYGKVCRTPQTAECMKSFELYYLLLLISTYAATDLYRGKLYDLVSIISECFLINTGLESTPKHIVVENIGIRPMEFQVSRYGTTYTYDPMIGIHFCKEPEPWCSGVYTEQNEYDQHTNNDQDVPSREVCKYLLIMVMKMAKLHFETNENALFYSISILKKENFYIWLKCGFYYLLFAHQELFTNHDINLNDKQRRLNREAEYQQRIDKWNRLYSLCLEYQNTSNDASKDISKIKKLIMDGIDKHIKRKIESGDLTVTDYEEYKKNQSILDAIVSMNQCENMFFNDQTNLLNHLTVIHDAILTGKKSIINDQLAEAKTYFIQANHGCESWFKSFIDRV